MNKKIAFILSGLTLVLVTLILVFYLQTKNKLSPVLPEDAEVVPTQVIEEMVTWTDPAEFTFQYPKSLSFNPHSEDQLNYAHVELASSTNAGNLIIWVKDTAADTIDDWIVKEKINNAIDSTLDSIPAKKILMTGLENKITLSAMRNGYLYQIEVNATDNEYWNKIFGQVVSTFTFTSGEKSIDQKTPATASEDTGSSAVESEGEEVIE